MTWVKLDDAFPSHPKIDAISDGAFRLHVTALCWSCQWLTDGFVPTDRLRALPGYRFKASHVAELTAPRPPDDRASWVEVPGGYQIHDFLDYQIPAAKVRADREAAAERMRKKRTPSERSGDVRPNKARTGGERSEELREKFADPVPDPYPTRPVPVPEESPSRGGSSEGGNLLVVDPDATPDDFEPFWLAFPQRSGKRIGKADAVRVWKRMSRADRAAAQYAVGHYASHCEVPGNPSAMDPHRWLTKRRWEDWLTPAAAVPARNGHARGPSTMDFLALAAGDDQ